MSRQSTKSMCDDVRSELWFSHPSEVVLTSIIVAITLFLLDTRVELAMIFIVAIVPVGVVMWLCHRIVVGRTCSLRRRLIIFLLSLVAPTAWVWATIAWIGYHPFRYYDHFVCTECGIVRMDTKYTLPFMSPSVTVNPTPVSEMGTQLVGHHDHLWLLSHGGLSGCVHGFGRCPRRAAFSENVSNFIRHVHKHEGATEANVWLKRSLHQDLSNAVRLWVYDYPTGDVDRIDHFKWRAVEDANWNEIYAEYTVDEEQ